MLVLKKTRIAVDVNVWRHKVFVRWLSCSIKDEEISIHAYDTVPNSRVGIWQQSDLYNSRRPHRFLTAPVQANFNLLAPMMVVS